MLLKSIKYKDFRCFRGELNIDLNCPNEKNIVVILGDNTHGKSTIVQSFVWCFYGIANFENPELYNRAIAKELAVSERTKPSVEVIFEHEGKKYTARREIEFYKTREGKMVPAASSSVFSMTYVDPVSGQTKPCGDRPNELAKAMNSMLPKDMAPYFFFEGEKNHELTTKSLSSAVRNLLGIEALLKMRDHMHGNTQKVSSKSVLGYYEEKQIDTDNLKAQAERDKQKRAEDEIEKVDKELEEITEQIRIYEEKIDDINRILREAEPTKLLQKRRDEIARDLKWENERLGKLYNEYLQDFNECAVDLFTLPLLSTAKKKLERMDLSDKGIVGLEVSAIKELLVRGVCLCGTDLKEGTLAYKNVEKYIDILPPKAVGVLVRQLQDSMVQSEYSAKGYVDKSQNKYQDIQFSIQKIHELERDENDNLEELKKMPKQETAQYEADLRNYKNRLEELRYKERIKIAYRQSQISARDTASNNYNMYAGKAKRNAEYALYYAYAKRIFDWLSLSYDEKEKSVRKMISISVTDIFNRIYSGNRSVYIDSTYNMIISPPADTGGIKAIQYFSYVGGLVSVARQVMSEREEGELYGEEYPLVLDAAFSHTDTKHTKAIAVELSNVTSQLIFAIMDKDWEHVGNKIDSKIQKTYKLMKLNENEVTIEEV